MDGVSVLRLEQISKTYQSAERALTVLSDITFELLQGDTCAIVGPSGSGKTTLLGLCAGLDAPSTGRITLCGVEIGRLSEDERAAIRNENVGFIFQSFQLIPTLSALENVMVPAELRGEKGVSARAKELLEKVGLGDRMHHYPKQLSGGEQQRVGIARAFINAPRILFADEPTGNLDADTGAIIESLLFELNAMAGTTLVLVTHDIDLAQRTERILRLRGGLIVSDTAGAASAAVAADSAIKNTG